jgi:excisionase family DNA binding protein
MEKLLFTRAEVAKVIGLSLASIESLTKSGQLPSVKIGRSVRVHVDALQEFCRKGTKGRTVNGGELHQIWQNK